MRMTQALEMKKPDRIMMINRTLAQTMIEKSKKFNRNLTVLLKKENKTSSPAKSQMK
jgi:hypothetical protein